MSRTKEDSGIETASREKLRITRPKLYKVILLNDDYTTMDFVISILESIFRKSPAEAVQIMLHVHQRGRGICGIFTKQVAETKVSQVTRRAETEGHPLQCVMESE